MSNIFDPCIVKFSQVTYTNSIDSDPYPSKKVALLREVRSRKLAIRWNTSVWSHMLEKRSKQVVRKECTDSDSVHHRIRFLSDQPLRKFTWAWIALKLLQYHQIHWGLEHGFFVSTYTKDFLLNGAARVYWLNRWNQILSRESEAQGKGRKASRCKWYSTQTNIRFTLRQGRFSKCFSSKKPVSLNKLLPKHAAW